MIPFSVLVVVWLFIVPEAFAGLILDIDARGVYEDNITGSVEDVDKKGDFYALLSASLGAYKNVGDGTFLFSRGDVSGSLYRRYSDLNAAVIGIGIGVYKEFSDVFSAEVTVKARRKEYKETGRSGNSFGGAFEMKQEVLPRLWIKEGYEYERNRAGAGIFSYDGHLFGLWSGYSLSPKTMLTSGYTFLSRKYEEPAGFQNRFHTVSVGGVRRILDKVYLNAVYYRQYIASNFRATSHTNNIYSLGVTYSY